MPAMPPQPGQMPPAPPMGPPGAGPGPGPEMGPAEDVMAADQAAADEQRGMIAESAPDNKKPFTVKVMQGLLESFKKTVKALAGDAIPVEQLEWEPPQGVGDKYDGPLPDPIFPAMVVINQAVEAAGPEFASKYGFDPMELVDDSALRKADAQLRRMGKDKALKEAMMPPEPGDEGPVTQGAPPPEDMGEDDYDMMNKAKVEKK